MKVADFLSGLDSVVVWYTLYRNNKETQADTDTKLMPGDIVVVGLESERTLKAWSVAKDGATPCELPRELSKVLTK